MKKTLTLLSLIAGLLLGNLQADVTLLPSNTQAKPGHALPLIIQLSNPQTSGDLSYQTQQLLPCTLTTSEQSTHALLTLRDRRAPGPISLAPFSFRDLHTYLDIPDNISGNCLLTIDAFPQARIMLNIHDNAPNPHQATPDSPIFTDKHQDTLTSSDTVQRYANHFSVYDPVYFVVGLRESLNAKFQLSFKYRLFDEDSTFSENTPLLSDLYFSYTQTALWDLGEDSAPFRDTSYKPAIFFLHKQPMELLPWLSLDSLQYGIEHESNGKDNLSSRSVNRAFVTPTFGISMPEDYYFKFGLKAYEYAFGVEENPDIADFIGSLDLFLRFGRIDDWQFSVYTHTGKFDRYGNIQVDFTYPLDLLWEDNLDAYLHLQYFNGYGESILEYNTKRPSQFRLGVMLLR